MKATIKKVIGPYVASAVTADKQELPEVNLPVNVKLKLLEGLSVDVAKTESGRYVIEVPAK